MYSVHITTLQKRYSLRKESLCRYKSFVYDRWWTHSRTGENQHHQLPASFLLTIVPCHDSHINRTTFTATPLSWSTITMLIHRISACTALIAAFAISSSKATAIKRDGHLDSCTANNERAQRIKGSFQFAYNGYKQYAFGHDELLPVSEGFSDSRYMFHLHWLRVADN